MPGRTNPENYTRGMAELRNLAGRQCPAEVAAYQKALAAHGNLSNAEAMADLKLLLLHMDNRTLSGCCRLTGAVLQASQDSDTLQ